MVEKPTRSAVLDWNPKTGTGWMYFESPARPGTNDCIRIRLGPRLRDEPRSPVWGVRVVEGGDVAAGKTIELSDSIQTPTYHTENNPRFQVAEVIVVE